MYINIVKYFLSILVMVSVSTSKVVYVVPIQGTIDLGLPPFIERVISTAENNNADGVIFDIDTFGGRVDAATQMKDIILDSKVTTVAFINKRAISAGALISLSCDSIFMTAGASIGAATAVDLQGNKASEKVISYMREEMASTAEANNRPRDVASGMVDEELSIPFIVNSQGDTLTSKDVEGFNEGKLVFKLPLPRRIPLKGMAHGRFTCRVNLKQLRGDFFGRALGLLFCLCPIRRSEAVTMVSR